VELLKQDTDLAAQLETEVRLALSEFGNPSENEAKATKPKTETDDTFAEGSEEALVDSELYLE